MKLVGLAALVGFCLLAGCATVSTALYAGGKSPALDENARIEAVPQPGFTEQLSVVLHPAGVPVARTSYSNRRPPPSNTALMPPAELKPPQLACTVTQTGENIEYIAATHYGRTWKWGTASFFVIEAALAAVFLLTDPPPGESSLPRRLAGVYFAADALVTAGLFFVPKRDVLKSERRSVVTPVRADCPRGVQLEVDGKAIDVAARGALPALGAAALERAIADPSSRFALRYQTRSVPLLLSASQRCHWLRTRRSHHQATTVCSLVQPGDQRGNISATLQVDPGALTGQPSASLQHRLNMSLSRLVH